MDSQRFNDLFEEQVETCRKVLVQKGKEYSTQDKLHNFKVAAELQGVSPAVALSGMMAKHTVSIYDMMQSGQTYPKAVWDEKLTDHLNYLILLNGIVTEEREASINKAVGNTGGILSA